MKNFRHSLIFILMLVLVAVFYEYPSRYGELPMKVNHSTSMALNYYQNDMNFFKPQVHNIVGGEGYFVAEFPILSYFVALLYKWFGVEEGLFRLVNFIILGLGLLALSKLVWRMTGDEMYSFFVPMILVSMPILGFYAFEFSTNVAALGFLLMGFNAFSKYYDDSKIRHWFWASFYFLLSGLLNWSFALMVVPLLIAFVLETAGSLYFKPDKGEIFKHKLLAIISFVVITSGVIGWIIFAQQFNEAHQVTINYDNRGIGSYFFPSTTPGFHINNQYQFQFEAVGLGISFLLFLWILFTPKHQNRLIYLLTISSILALVVYLIFLYNPYHSEGLWLFYTFPIVVLVAFGIMIKRRRKTTFSKWSFKWFLSVGVLICIYFSKAEYFYPFSHLYTQSIIRFDDSFTDLNQKNVQSFLAEHNITYPTKVVSMTDVSENTSLYFYNLTGWTNRNKGMSDNFIQECVDDGAKYLITTMNEKINYLPATVAQNPIANYKQKIFVFDIQHLKE